MLGNLRTKRACKNEQVDYHILQPDDLRCLVNSDHLAIVADAVFFQHKPPAHHIEKPERLAAVYKLLGQQRYRQTLTFIKPRPATLAELTLVHDLDYLTKVRELAARGWGYLSPDTYLDSDTYTTAAYAAGSCLELADLIMAGKFFRGMAFIRPPGHHADRREGRGFCIFNNAALVARHLIVNHKLERILIVDWDLHHGNGTQAIFYDSNQALYFSTHQYPFYPGTGWITEVGVGAGEGYTINLAFPEGCGDRVYLKAFREILAPVVEQYRPQFVIVSNGFDLLAEDPIGSMLVSPAGLAQLSKVVRELADHYAEARLLHVFEGGYSTRNLDRTLNGLISSLSAQGPAPELEPIIENQEGEKIIAQVKILAAKYWRFPNGNIATD